MPARVGAGFDRIAASPPARALLARPALAAALLLALLVVVHLWPVLVGGQMLSPLAFLFQFSPWKAGAPPDIDTYRNSLLSDIGLAHYPWNAFARDMLHAGTFPAWNPHVFAGAPFFSNPQTVLFSPFSLPLWILPLDDGLGVSAALKLWAAAFGTYLLVRELRLGFLPGLLAGIAYGLCSFHVTWLTHESLPAVSAVLPWMLWLVERVLRRGDPAAAIGLAVATGVAVTGGHPGTQLHVLAATALYAALRAGTVGGVGWTRRLRGFGLATAAVTVGVALAGVVLVPELRSSEGTLGTEARKADQLSAPGSDLPFSVVRTALFPDWWGRPSDIEATLPQGTKGSAVNYNERTLYAGAVALLLALTALVLPGGWRRKAPFAVLGLLALAIPLQAPGLTWLVQHLPGFDVVQNQRMHFVFALSVAVLAAFGLDALLRRRAEAGLRPCAVVGAALVAGVVGFLAAGPEVADVVRHFATGADVDDAEALAATSVVWWLLWALAAGAALLALRRWPARATRGGVALGVAAAADMLHVAHDYQPMGPASKIVPPRTPAIAFLQERTDEGRFVGLNFALTNDFALTYGLDDVRGYDPPQPTLRYFRLWQLVRADQPNWAPFGAFGLDESGLAALSLLGARYVVSDPGAEAPLPALRRIYDGEDATIFENPGALPRAMVAPAVHVTADEDETLATIADAEGFDPRAAVLVEQDERGAAALASQPAARGRARIVREENAEVVLEAELDRPGLVVLNDQLTTGWSVEVDGRAAEPVRVNDVMRGVVVDAGRHRVAWSYAVPGLRLGLLLSAAAALVLLGAAVALALGRRARPRRD